MADARSEPGSRQPAGGEGAGGGAEAGGRSNSNSMSKDTEEVRDLVPAVGLTLDQRAVILATAVSM